MTHVHLEGGPMDGGKMAVDECFNLTEISFSIALPVYVPGPKRRIRTSKYFVTTFLNDGSIVMQHLETSEEDVPFGDGLEAFDKCEPAPEDE